MNRVTATSCTVWGGSRGSSRIPRRLCVAAYFPVDLPLPRSNRHEARNPNPATAASEATAAAEALGSADTRLGACSHLASKESPLLPRRLGAMQDADPDRADNRSILTASEMPARREVGRHAPDRIHRPSRGQMAGRIATSGGRRGQSTVQDRFCGASSHLGIARRCEDTVLDRNGT